MFSIIKKLFSQRDMVKKTTDFKQMDKSDPMQIESNSITPPKDDVKVHEKELDINTKTAKISISTVTINENPIKQKPYNVSEINAESTKIKNQEGFIPAINFIKNFINQNNIDLNDLISLLKRLLTYMKKEISISDNEILDYIEKEFSKHEERNKIENYVRIADILKRIDVSYAIAYLEENLNSNNSDASANLEHFDSLILLSDYYLQSKQADKAFQTARRAGLLVTNFNDKYHFINRQFIIAELSAKICYEGQKHPLYADYIHYQIVAFVLKQCQNLLSFELLPYFYRDKNEATLIETQNGDSDKIINSLNNLNIIDTREQLIKDIYEYTFQKLPIELGIPPEYLRPEFEIPDRKENYSEYRSFIDKSMEYESKPFSELHRIHEFANIVVKRYYEFDNQ